MRLRTHCLFLLLAIVLSIFFDFWLRDPVWQMRDQRKVRFGGVNTVCNEWSLLVSDDNNENWCLETRKGNERQVVRSVPLSVPKLKGKSQHVRISPNGTTGAPLVFIDHWNESQPDGSLKVEERAWLMDQETGQLLRQEPIIGYGMGPIANHRDRIALIDKEQVWLFNDKNDPGRSVPMKFAANLTFSPDGKWLVCTLVQSQQLYFIDWKTASLIKPLNFDKMVHSLGFLSDDVILISEQHLSGQKVSRWRWDGKELHAISPGVVLRSNSWPLRFIQQSDGTLHVSVFIEKGWPKRWTSFFYWLLEKNIPIERWYPQEYQWHFHVLDSMDRPIREFEEPWQMKLLPAIKPYAVEIQPVNNSSMTVITLWNTSPTWPNSLAVGLLIYLALYTIARCCFTLSIPPHASAPAHCHD